MRTGSTIILALATTVSLAQAQAPAQALCNNDGLDSCIQTKVALTCRPEQTVGVGPDSCACSQMQEQSSCYNSYCTSYYPAVYASEYTVVCGGSGATAPAAPAATQAPGGITAAAATGTLPPGAQVTTSTTSSTSGASDGVRAPIGGLMALALAGLVAYL